MSDWLLGFIGSSLIAGFAYWRQSLSKSGVMAAVMVGTILFALGTAEWFIPIIAFFVSSTLLSKWKKQKKSCIESRYEKTGKRDAEQVLANGGIGVLLCIGNSIWPDPIWWIVYIGVIASVNADTWATEIGVLSKNPPRSIRNGSSISAGTSGGISLLGLAASFLGSIFISIISISMYYYTHGWLYFLDDKIEYVLALFIFSLSGTIGSITDSFIGAYGQVMYRCKACGKEVELKIHCNELTYRIRGIKGLNNDIVNLISSVVGGATALLLMSLFV